MGAKIGPPVRANNARSVDAMFRSRKSSGCVRLRFGNRGGRLDDEINEGPYGRESLADQSLGTVADESRRTREAVNELAIRAVRRPCMCQWASREGNGLPWVCIYSYETFHFALSAVDIRGSRVKCPSAVFRRG
jgi:hypothetical protein